MIKFKSRNRPVGEGDETMSKHAWQVFNSTGRPDQSLRSLCKFSCKCHIHWVYNLAAYQFISKNPIKANQILKAFDQFGLQKMPKNKVRRAASSREPMLQEGRKNTKGPGIPEPFDLLCFWSYFTNNFSEAI